MNSLLFKKLGLIFAFCIIGSFSLSAQTPNNETPSADTTKYIVIKNDGNEYIGVILSDDGREVLILTQSLGKVYIPKSEIKTIRKLDYSEDIQKDGQVNTVGVFTTRYQFTTNCFPIKKGENYAMINLYGPEVHFAVNKDLSVGVMSTWIGSPIALAFKYTHGTANPKINVGVGSLIGTSGYLNSGRGRGGLYWGMITYGDRKSNATLSLGYGHFNDGNKYTYSVEVLQPGTYPSINGEYPFIPVQDIRTINAGFNIQAPIIGLAGQTKVGKKARFIYDCMYLIGKSNNNQGYQPVSTEYNQTTWQIQQVVVGEWQSSSAQNILILMPGMRFQRTEDKAFQISLAGVISEDTSFPLPMASWFYKF